MADIVVSAAIDTRRAETGAQRFNRSLGAMGSAVGRTGRIIGGLTRTVFSLGGALTGLSGVLAVREIVQASDNFSLLQSRLALVVQEGTQASQVMGGLEAAAERARAPVSTLATAYTRNAKALEAMGRSEAEGIRLTENLSKVITISGADAQQASAGMLQLSQAIASGRFQGDEFRSVAENLPEILRILERQTGKTAGELRALAKDGKLTGDVLVTALLNATTEIDRKFDQMPQTAGQAFSVLSDQASRTFGEIANVTGVSEAWAEAFNEIRDAMDGPAFQNAAKFAAEFVRDLGLGVAEAARGVDELSIQWEAWTGAISNSESWSTFLQNWEDLSNLVSAVGQGVAWMTNQVFEITGLSETAAEAEKLADGLRAAGRFAQPMLTTESGVPAIQAAAPTSRTPITFGSGTDAAAEKRAERITKRAQERLEIDRLRNDLLQAEIEGNETVARALENQISLRRTVDDELRKTSPELARQLETQVLLNDELERQKTALDKATEVGQAFADTISGGFRDAIEQGKGFGDVLTEIGLKLAEVALQKTIIDPASENFASGFGSLFSSAVGGATSGAGSFAFPGGSGVAFANGGILNGPARFSGGGVRGFAGEAGPEALLPLTRLPGGKMGVAASGSGGGSKSVTINVYGDPDEKTVARMRSEAQNLLANATPSIVEQSVSAVRRRNLDDRRFLAR